MSTRFSYWTRYFIFWVARMIISLEYRKEQPFSNVYLTGLVRDKKGRKMSKQLGNSPDVVN